MRFGANLIVGLILLLVGAFPAWSYSHNRGYSLSSSLGLVLVIVSIMLLMYIIKPRLYLTSVKAIYAQLTVNNRHTEIDRRIAESAYYKAEKRGFEPGFEEQDWIESEKDILTITASRRWPY